MGKRCCGCCPGGSACCGCCCSKRAATMAFSLFGLALAAAVVVPPVYVYTTDRDFTKLFPALRVSKSFLRQVTEAKFGGDSVVAAKPYDDDDDDDDERPLMNNNGEQKDSNGGQIQQQNSRREKYKLAIFQLLDDIESHSPCLALASFSLGCLNMPIHLLLLGGAIFRAPCLMLPWLAVTLLEHLVVGVPVIVFSGIVSLYLACQLQLYLVAAAVIGSIVMLFLLSISSWFTVYACYNDFYARQGYYYENGGGGATATVESTQPLLGANVNNSGPSTSHAPALPPGHPNGGSNSYHLGQYPQYYPPHHHQHSQSRQLPTAPPPSNGGMYPHLPNA